MEPLSDFRDPPKRPIPVPGFKSDGQKIPLALYLHVNDFTDFQRKVLPVFLKPDHDDADIQRAIAALNAHVHALTLAGFKPKRADGDMVNQPDHYKRFPIEPTFFNQENGIDWLRGNANKYICRYPFKNGIEDLQKARRNLVMYLGWIHGDEGWSK